VTQSSTLTQTPVVEQSSTVTQSTTSTQPSTLTHQSSSTESQTSTLTLFAASTHFSSQFSTSTESSASTLSTMSTQLSTATLFSAAETQSFTETQYSTSTHFVTESQSDAASNSTEIQTTTVSQSSMVTISTYANHTSQRLTYYWPICNDLSDQAGSAHMQQGNLLTSFTADRFGNNNSALALNGGWLQVPQGNYFDTPEFTISVWVFPQNISLHAAVFDFGNKAAQEGIALTFDSVTTSGSLKPTFLIWIKPAINLWSHVESSQPLMLNKWQLLTATFDSKTMKIYINGTLTGSRDFNVSTSTMSQPLSSNYIGSNGSLYTSASYLDDLRIYKTSLNQSEILQLVNANGSSE
jgi:hypothetical protein